MIAAELSKQLCRVRTAALVGTCAFVSVLVAIGLGRTARSTLQVLGASGSAVVLGSSGLAVGIAALVLTSSLLVPVVFVLFVGEPLAAEAQWGSLRYLLVKPVARWRVLGAKVLVGAGLAVLAAVAVPVLATAVGTAYFGWHPVASASGSLTQTTFPLFHTQAIGVWSAVGRLLLATLYVVLGSGAIVGVAVLVAVVSDSVLGALSAGIGTYIISDILASIPSLHVIWPVLPTEYYDRWTDLFDPGAPLTGMVHGVVSQLGWLAVTLVCAFAVFERRDVLV